MGLEARGSRLGVGGKVFELRRGARRPTSICIWGSAAFGSTLAFKVGWPGLRPSNRGRWG